MSVPFSTNTKMLDTITGDSTSDAFDVSQRKRWSVEASIDPLTVIGSATIELAVSNDGVNFVIYNRIVSNITDDNTETDTRTDSVTLDATTPVEILLLSEDYFRFIKAIYTTVTGGIVTVSVDDGGTGYSVDDILTLDDGTGGTVRVTGETGGVIDTVEVVDPGQDYTIGTHTTSGAGNDDAIIDVLTVSAGDFTATLQAHS